MREVKVPSVIPVYSIGAVWILYALAFPLYRLSHFLIATALSIAAYIILSKVLPKKTVLVEDEPQPIRTGNSEHDAQLEQWQSYHRELAALRRKIANENLGAKLDSILSVSGQIFDILREDADAFRKVRTFSSYYFPTTLSLLRRYADYEDNPTQGPNVTESRRRIEHAAGMIEEAFRNALDRLYKDEALNTEVEIQVMEEMLRKDGIGSAADPFSKKK